MVADGVTLLVDRPLAVHTKGDEEIVDAVPFLLSWGTSGIVSKFVTKESAVGRPGIPVIQLVPSPLSKTTNTGRDPKARLFDSPVAPACVIGGGKLDHVDELTD